MKRLASLFVCQTAAAILAFALPSAMAAEPGSFSPGATNPFPSRYSTAVYPASANAEAPLAASTQPAPPSDAAPLPIAPPSTDANKSTPVTARLRQLPPVATAAASLGIVLGLFMLVMWVVRRSGPRDAGLLPSEAVEVLGRAPFVGRQQVHLVRCGNKLLLVSVTPTATTTLTEITEPAEVERLLDLCQPAHGGSPLRNMLERFGGSPRDRRYAGRHEASDVDFSQLEAMHASAEELLA